MGFLDKINYSMIVNSLNKSAREDTMKYFSRMSLKLAHSTNMCFTVTGIPQDWQDGESSPLNNYEWDENDQFAVCWAGRNRSGKYFCCAWQCQPWGKYNEVYFPRNSPIYLAIRLNRTWKHMV